jgi:hypothetical protein
MNDQTATRRPGPQRAWRALAALFALVLPVVEVIQRNPELVILAAWLIEVLMGR